MTLDTAPTWLDPELDETVSTVTERVSRRLIDAVESEVADEQGGTRLGTDDRHRQLMLGAWIGEELRSVNE